MSTMQSTSQQIKETFMRMLTLYTSLVFLLASILLLGISSAADTQDNESIEKGKMLFIKYCSTCDLLLNKKYH